MSKIILRDYQDAAIASIWRYWDKVKGNPLIVAPCGSGKSLMIADLVRSLCQDYGARVLVITHRSELLRQNESELRKVWPKAPTGFFSAGIGERDYDSQIIFAGIQTIAKKITDFDPFDIVIIDEAHLIPRNTATQYGEACGLLKIMNPACRFVGMTATPFRLDSGLLTQGDGALFDKVVHDIPVQGLVDKGHLVPVHAKRGAAVASMDGVKRRAGEFVGKEMAAAFDDVLEGACQEVIERGHDRRAWMIFCASVDHAWTAQQIMNDNGVAAEVITGKTPKIERNDIVSRYKAGGIRCLINVSVLTTGFNAPVTDMIAIIRATDSAALYVQIVGRAMRTHPGKTDALLLDFGGNVERHGPIDDVTVKPPGGDGDGEAPAKACPSCHSILAASARVCPDCLFEFPTPEPAFENRAFSGAVMSSQRHPQWVPVDSVSYHRHKKTGKPDSVRVEYKCGLRTHKDWLCFDHEGAASRMARKKTKTYNMDSDVTTDGFLAAATALPFPAEILIKPDGKYERVSGIRMRRQETSGTEDG